MGKDAMIPAAIVRAVAPVGPPTGAAGMVRPPDEDMFRESPLQSIHARRTIREFGAGPVPREAVEEAVRAACASPAPHHNRPWLFVALETEPSMRRLLAAMAAAWVRDLRAEAVPQEVIDRRVGRSDALLGRAPVLIVPAVSLRAADT